MLGKIYCLSLSKKHLSSTFSAIKSPQILELSGIGQQEILSKIGVDLVIDLPGVGENVQEHTVVSMPHELAPNTDHETFDLLRDPAYFLKAKELQLSKNTPSYILFLRPLR